MGHSGQFKPGHGGKPRGAKNRLTGAFKDGLLHVYTELGGKTAMLEWARSNQTSFYLILAKLTPTELAIDLRAETRTLVIDMVTSRAELEAAHTAQEDDDVVDIDITPEPERPSLLVPDPDPEPDPPDVVPHFS